MPSQLYRSIQCTIQHLVMRVQMLQKHHNKTGEATVFHVELNGTRRLEHLFGAVRTIDHQRNPDAVQLCDKLAIAANIESLYNMYPHLRPPMRRLHSADRASPGERTGDVDVTSANVQQLWAEGCNAAVVFLDAQLWFNRSPDGQAGARNFFINAADLGITMDAPHRQQMQKFDDEEDLPDPDTIGEEDICVSPLDTYLAPVEALVHHHPYVDIDGKPVHVQRLINLVVLAPVPCSNDRLRRVAGFQASPSSLPSQKCCVALFHQPFACVVKATACCTVAVFAFLQVCGNATWHSDITLEDLSNNPTTEIEGQWMGFDLVDGKLRFNRRFGANVRCLAGAVSWLNPDLDGDVWVIPLDLANVLFNSLPRHSVPLCAILPYEGAPVEAADIIEEKWPCLFCGVHLAKGIMRAHVGGHILGGDVPINPDHQGAAEPCGFCGSHKGSCRTWLIIRRRGKDICVSCNSQVGEKEVAQTRSTCPYFCTFSTAAAMKTSTRSPCTNRPVFCPIRMCSAEIVWKYNLAQHLAVHHSLVNTAVPIELQVSRDEQNAVEAFICQRKRLLDDVPAAERAKRAHSSQLADGPGAVAAAAEEGGPADELALQQGDADAAQIMDHIDLQDADYQTSSSEPSSAMSSALSSLTTSTAVSTPAVHVRGRGRARGPSEATRGHGHGRARAPARGQTMLRFKK